MNAAASSSAAKSSWTGTSAASLASKSASASWARASRGETTAAEGIEDESGPSSEVLPRMRFFLVDRRTCPIALGRYQAMDPCRWELPSQDSQALATMATKPLQGWAACAARDRRSSHWQWPHMPALIQSPCAWSCSWTPIYPVPSRWHLHNNRPASLCLRFCTCHRTIYHEGRANLCECPLFGPGARGHHHSGWEVEDIGPTCQRQKQRFFWARRECLPACRLGKYDAAASRTLPLWWTSCCCHPWAHPLPGCHLLHLLDSSSLPASHHCSGHDRFGSLPLWQKISNLPNRFFPG